MYRPWTSRFVLLPLNQVVIPFTIKRYGHIAVLTLYNRRRKRLCRRIINKLEFPLCRGDAAARALRALSNCEGMHAREETHIEPEHRF
jgi:hypothetical protein